MKCYISLIIILVLSSMTLTLLAQNSNPLDEMLTNPNPTPKKVNKSADSDSLVNDIIRVNYEKKNAQLAMMMSALVPGAGQFYVDKSSLTAYIFPIIEIAVIGGIVYYDKQGDDKTKAYKKYATETVTMNINGYTYTGPRYRRDFQNAVQPVLAEIRTGDVYDAQFFNLDIANSQHFFEDIGKYNKYIFGWADWYLTYAQTPVAGQPIITPTVDPNLADRFIFTINDYEDNPQLYNTPYNKWISNQSLANPTGNGDAPYSALRAKYIKLRKDSEDKYRVANYLSFGIALNHITSAIDAVVVTNKKNRLYLSGNDVKFQYFTAVNNGHLTPTLGMSLAF